MTKPKKADTSAAALALEAAIVQSIGRNPKHRDTERYGRKLKFVFHDENELKEANNRVQLRGWASFQQFDPANFMMHSEDYGCCCINGSKSRAIVVRIFNRNNRS